MCSTWVPRTRNRFGDRSFAVAGPRFWNSLPIRLRQISSYGQFRRYLKNHLFGIWEITAQCDAWFSALCKYSYLLTYLSGVFTLPGESDISNACFKCLNVFCVLYLKDIVKIVFFHILFVVFVIHLASHILRNAIASFKLFYDSATISSSALVERLFSPEEQILTTSVRCSGLSHIVL